MTPALCRQLGNVQRFAELEEAPNLVLISEALKIAQRVLPHQNFLRFFGVGDMQPGSVRFIGVLSTVVPELKLWVATRRFDMAAQLVRHKNIHVMLGLDATTRATDVTEVRQLLKQRKGDYFASWVQRDAQERVPSWVSIIFAEHHLRHRADWSQKRASARVCPATIAGGAAHDGACARCQRCFTKEH